jgi:glycosyltransferase 2 family protein
MRLSRRDPPEGALQGPPAPAGARSARVAAEVRIDDYLAPRARVPSDLLRCVTACVEIALLFGLGWLATATARGAEHDLVQVSQKIESGFTWLLIAASVALFALPVALACWLIFLGQYRRLAEGTAIGLIAGGVTAGFNALLRLSGLAALHLALALGNTRIDVPLDTYLAGLVAFMAVVGMTGLPRWRTAFWLTIAVYCVASLAASGRTTTILSLLISVLIGQAVGSGLRYAIGTDTERPSAADIAAALSDVVAPVVEIRRVAEIGTENRRYSARTGNGEHLEVTVFDRDQQTAAVVYRIYRRLLLKSQVSRGAPLTLSRAVERRALMTYAVRDAGVRTPRLRALMRVGPEAAVLAIDHVDGTTLADLPGTPSDEQLERVWDALHQLHRHRVTHRSLTADRIALSGDDDCEVTLLEPGDGDVAATDLQLRLDNAQLVATMALLVGADRAGDIAVHEIGRAEAARLVPLLQPVVMHRTTRAALRQHKDVLPALRKRLVGNVAETDLPAEQLERFRPRTVVTLVATIIAVYFVIGEFSKHSIGDMIRQSDWRWLVLTIVLTAVTYLGAAWTLSGFVLERLHLFRTLLAQLAGSFITLVTPAAVGGIAINLRYLRKADVEPADAAASVGVSQVFAFALHITLLIIFAALAGTTGRASFRVPGWVYIALGVLAGAVLLVLAVPASRRLVRSRLAPTLSQVIPRLLDIAQRPAKLVEGIGGALLVSLGYIFCLYASVEAVGAHAALPSIAVVFLTGNAIGSAFPTPGGLGAVEGALTLGLKLAGVPGANALAAVFLFRFVTFWLPVPVGWGAMSFLQHRDYL